MKKLKKFLALSLIATAAIGYGIYTKMKSGLTLRISESQINATLAQKFPLESEYLLLKTNLHQPKVTLNEELNRMEIDVNATITTLGSIGFKIGSKEVGLGSDKSYEAKAKVAGKVDYDPEQGVFFFKDATILDIDTGSLPEKLKDKGISALSFIAKQVLNRLPVYKLDDSQTATRSAKLLLEDVTIADGKMVVKLKLPEK